jgi:hypothetical protein
VKQTDIDLMLARPSIAAMLPHAGKPRKPAVVIALEHEGPVHVLEDCRPGEKARLHESILANDGRADLIARAFELIEGDEAA